MVRIKLGQPDPARAAACKTAMTALFADRAIFKIEAPFVYFNDPNGVPVGYIEVSVFDGHIRLSAISTRPDRRGQGWGSYLLKKVLMAADAGRAPVSLNVDNYAPGGKALTKRQLHRWYRNHGFVKKNKHDPDALVRKVPRWATLTGLPFNEARRLANKHGANTRPFDKDENGMDISWGVTPANVLTVPVPGTIAWWEYRKQFVHDLLLEQEAEEASDG